MKIKVEIEMTPEEAKELYSNIPVATLPIVTELTTQFQKQWVDQMQLAAKTFYKG